MVKTRGPRRWWVGVGARPPSSLVRNRAATPRIPPCGTSSPARSAASVAIGTPDRSSPPISSSSSGVSRPCRSLEQVVRDGGFNCSLVLPRHDVRYACPCSSANTRPCIWPHMTRPPTSGASGSNSRSNPRTVANTPAGSSSNLAETDDVRPARRSADAATRGGPRSRTAPLKVVVPRSIPMK